MQLFDCWDFVSGRTVKQKYPPTREEAVKLGLLKYWPGTACPRHPTEQYLHYVKSSKAACCVLRDAVDDYNLAAANGEPLTAADASARGLDYYWDPTPHACGHTGKCTLRGSCYECRHVRRTSPRQTAIRAGESWYLPDADDLCPGCDKHARRRVSNGSCEECERLRKPDNTAAVPFYRQHPDMVLSFSAAKSMGLNVYRTGEACKYGHRGWRYVVTRGCLTCMGRG